MRTRERILPYPSRTHMNRRTPNPTQNSIHRLREIFPDCVSESHDTDGNTILAVDFDLLRQALSGTLVDGPRERYRLDWPGKREALLAANAPVHKTLRPCRVESVDFDRTKNLFIEGDNLDALKLLQESYLGRIKMIYIDPPYNTGNDGIYKDNYSESINEFLKKSGINTIRNNRLHSNAASDGRLHSPWLTMMYPRLKLARTLLRNDGIAIISIDEKEHDNLVKLGTLVFGEENFCGEIIWKNSVKNDQRYISIQHEYFVVFVKSKQDNKGDWEERKEGLTEIHQAFAAFRKKHGDDWHAIHAAARAWYNSIPESSPIFASRHYNWMDERGVYCPDNIAGPEDGQYTYDVLHPTTGHPCKRPSSGWRYPEKTMLERIADNRIHFGKDHTVVPYNKTYLTDTEFQSLGSVRVMDGRGASRRLKKLFGVKVFTNPKDEFLLKDLFKAMKVSGDDIVLDFFAGSAASMHAVFELNKETGSACRCILVQLGEELPEMRTLATGGAKRVIENAICYLRNKGLPQNISEIAKERLRLVSAKYRDKWNGDTGFRVLKIDTPSRVESRHLPSATRQDCLKDFVDNQNFNRDPEELLFQVLLDLGMDPALPVERKTVRGKVLFSVGGKELLACFDSGITTNEAKEIARSMPHRVVFRENGFASDALRAEVEIIIQTTCPGVEFYSI